MPEEIAIITVFALLAGTLMTVTRMILGYRERTRFGLGAKTGGDQSMTTSQLERMIRSAVADSVDPLARRIEKLEGAAAPRLPERSGVAEIEDHELGDYAPEELPVRRSRTR